MKARFIENYWRMGMKLYKTLRKISKYSTGKYFKYTAKATTPVSSNYLVKVTANALNIRKGPGTSYTVVGCIRDKGVYTIVQEQDGWGKLKSGAGWISLAYTQKR